MRVGDVSRQRRFADPARQRWYAYYRSLRFATRMRQAATADEHGNECHQSVRCHVRIPADPTPPDGTALLSLPAAE